MLIIDDTLLPLIAVLILLDELARLWKFLSSPPSMVLEYNEFESDDSENKQICLTILEIQYDTVLYTQKETLSSAVITGFLSNFS